MKIKSFVFLICLSAFTLLNAQDKDSVSFKEYFSNGKIATDGYKNSKNIKIGKWTWYFENGKEQMTGEYNDKGWKIGLWQWFYSDGSLKKQEVFTGNGENKAFYDNKQLYYSCKVEDGMKQGDYKEYHKNGKLKMQGTYKDNELDGKVKWWFANSNPEMEGTLKAGKRDGHWIYYFHDSGNKNSEGDYVNDKEEGR